MFFLFGGLAKAGEDFIRMTCCGKGVHNYCAEDLKSMTKIGDNCPLCRHSKAPTSKEEEIKYVRKGKGKEDGKERADNEQKSLRIHGARHLGKTIIVKHCCAVL